MVELWASIFYRTIAIQHGMYREGRDGWLRQPGFLQRRAQALLKEAVEVLLRLPDIKHPPDTI